MLRQYRNTPIYAKLASVFDRIRNALPDKTAIPPAWLDDRIILFSEPVTAITPQTWETIANAIRENRQVSITYPSPSEKTSTQRTIDPYYLVYSKGEWYVTGHCHRHDAIRTFAVSRITAASLLNKGFFMPAKWSRQKMFGDELDVHWKDEFHRVRIRFSPIGARYIHERQWHPKQMIKSFKNGTAVIEFTTNHLDAVLYWVRSWGPEATILGPPILVERMKADIGKMAKLY